MNRFLWFTKTRSVLFCLSFLCLVFAGCTSVTITVGDATPTSGVSAASGQGTTGANVTVQEKQIAQSVFNAINKDRAAAGLATLQWSDALVKSARQHNTTMMTTNQLSHQLPGEPELGSRETQQGVKWTQAAENIGFTEDISENGALGLHKAMMAEKPPDDGHRTNILDTQNNRLGVDILFDSVHGRLWLTEDFAKI